jgi:hypothetical protein
MNPDFVDLLRAFVDADVRFLVVAQSLVERSHFQVAFGQSLIVFDAPLVDRALAV